MRYQWLWHDIIYNSIASLLTIGRKIWRHIKVKVPGLSLHSGKPVLPTVHVTLWSLGVFHAIAISFSPPLQLIGAWDQHSYMIVHCPTRYHLFTSMVRRNRPDSCPSGQCVVRDKPRTPYHIDRPAREFNPRPSGQHSTESPILTTRLTRTTVTDHCLAFQQLPPRGMNPRVW